MGDFDRIADFVESKIGRTRIKLSRNTIIDEDLRIMGDDAYDFMESFFSNFGINPRGFDFRVYFDPEGFDPIGLSYLIRRLRKIEPPLERKSLTLGDLEDALRIGEWPEQKLS